jgi:hypothetical protein
VSQKIYKNRVKLGEVGHFWTGIFPCQAHYGEIDIKLPNSYFKIALYVLKNHTCTTTHLKNITQNVFKIMSIRIKVFYFWK